MKTLEDFIYPTQKKLFKALCIKYDKKVIGIKGKFILVKGTAPVMLVAHLDTVHEQSVCDICKSADGNILMSPQGIGGDDRCGVYALATIYELTDKKPFLLFTCNEEIGGLGAQVFCECHREKQLPAELDTLKFIVEIDRRGSHDAVFYDFEEYIAGKGFTFAHGSFSDISYIAPELNVAAVNLSSGYYNAHTRHEYINRAELESTIEKVCEMVNDAVLADFPRFEYAERVKEIPFSEDWFIGDGELSLFAKLNK